MKRVVLMLALALVIPALALASNFDYYTVGSFNGGGSSVTVGTATVSFQDSITHAQPGQGTAGCTAGCEAFGLSNTGFDPNGGFVTLGSFHTTPGTGDLAGTSFTLYLYQTLPTGANPYPGSFGGSLTGTIAGNSSTGKWYLTDLSSTVLKIQTSDGNITIYTLALNNDAVCGAGKPCIQIGGPGQDGTVQASVTQVPEPASIMLFGSGLTGLAGVIRRRFKK